MSVNDVAKCGAQTRTGGRCQQPAMAGRKRCRLHGGKTPRGLANPRTITGRYSADMPTRMLVRFEEAQRDRDLLSLRGDVSLITAVIGERLSEMEQATTDVDWDGAVAKFVQVTEEGRDWTWERVQQGLRELGELLEGRRAERSIFEEVRSLVDQRARLVAQENRRLVDLKQNLTVEEDIVFAQVLVATVKKYISDQDVLNAINRDVQAIINAPPVIDVAPVSAGPARRTDQD